MIKEIQLENPKYCDTNKIQPAKRVENVKHDTLSRKGKTNYDFDTSMEERGRKTKKLVPNCL